MDRGSRDATASANGKRVTFFGAGRDVPNPSLNHLKGIAMLIRVPRRLKRDDFTG